MRVMPSLPRSGLGLTLLATFVAAAPAQQARRLGQPAQKSVAQPSAEPLKTLVRPTHFEWNELRQLQASLPPMALSVEQPKQATTKQPIGGVVPEMELPDLGLPRPDVQPGHARPVAPQGDIERLAPCASFPGIPPAGSTDWAGQGDATGAIYPPNGAGSVGPNHLMVMAANTTLIQDRLGATISTVDTLVFWTALAPASVTYCRLDYDGVSGRWLATARGGAGVGACTIMWAISTTDDPTGGWDFYSVPADPALAPPTFPDGLKMGYNETWVAVTADMYSSTVAGGNQGSRLYTLDLGEATDGDFDPVTIATFIAGFTTAVTGLFTPVVNFRNVPVRSLDDSIADLWILNSRATSGTNVAWQVMRITGTGAAPAVAPTPGSPFGGALSLMFIPINYTNLRQGVPQAGDVRLLDPLQPDGTFASTRARIQDAVVRNGHIYIVHGSGLPGPNAATPTSNGVSFYELDPTLPFAYDGVTGVGPFVQQVQVTDGVNTTMMHPSIAVNCANDVLIGFSRSDVLKDPEAAYMMRLGTDALNTMGPTTTLKLGDDSWWQVIAPPGSPTIGAWGNYSSTAIDPNDDKTLWTLQPYAAARVGVLDSDSRWGTWWGRLGDCEIRPVITDHPDGLNSCIGNPVSFSVTATTGSNVLTYQWRLNGVDILGATSDTYSIPSVIGTDEGTYDVVICGCGQEISLPAILEFDEPTITTQPQEYTAGLGEVAAFFVVATPSIGSLSYQWFHNNDPVGIDDDILAVGPVVGQDYGPYHCIVTDGCGTIQTITVLLRPPIVTNKTEPAPHTDIVVEPKAQIGCVNDSVAFSIVAAPGGSTYQWRKDGADIPFETSDTLVLNGLAFADAGLYDVLVDIGSEVLESHVGILAMADNPVITNQPDSVVVNGPQLVVFSLTATGQGPLTYQWKHEAPTGSVFLDIPGATNPVYMIEDAPPSAAGRYRCTVKNQCGVTQSITCRLTFL